MNSFKERLLVDAKTRSIHLNNAGVGPLMKPAFDKIQHLTDQHSEVGSFAIMEEAFKIEEYRSIFATFLGTSVDNVSFMSSCSSALSQVALSYKLQAGDIILGSDQEYPSNAYPWLEAANKYGAEYIQIKADPSNHELCTTKVLEALQDDRVNVLALSWVQFQNGSTINIDLISKECQKREILFVLDGIQALGVLPFDFDKSGVDAICGGSHKWLGAPVGLGFLLTKPELRKKLYPRDHGALNHLEFNEPFQRDKAAREDGRRFEPGALNLSAIAAVSENLKVLEAIGQKVLYQHSFDLSKYLYEGLKDMGAHVFRVEGWNSIRSPILTFKMDKIESSILEEELKMNCISCTPRLGGLRLAPHIVNDKSDIEAVLNIILKCMN